MTDIENLQACLKLITDIRAQSTNVWKTIGDGMTGKHGEQEKEAMFLSELKIKLDSITNNVKELESNLTTSNPIVTHLPLGNSVYLSLDASLETVPIYNQLVSSYKWLENSHDYAAKAASLLSQNPLSRSYGKATKSRRRLLTTSHTAPPHSLDNLINAVNRMYGDMSFNVIRPCGTKLNAIVELTLERVLKSVLVFKGLMIEWVVVKAYSEDTSKNEGDPPDVWSSSRYEVFQKITENVNAAMLNFQSPVYPEMSVKSFMTYLHSYVTLFTDKCRKCGYHLHNNIPPTWREFKTLEPFHEDCRP